ncbi:undecaprenyl/decaprenyl-phosphate alpha-N-acetylglucosaminyl 1-phosphate transferase [Candidatus Sulfidibacterium hydrothermale]|uniref:glycosyltransferase family 4 protein n=1 Tax=Candidatus Sulfidibacterium hydrothermale TaxID=2875962 RepID=UPI001F0A889A|nr:MraY family glycosyltransferase [Candidatus Sulfidibacterium hydrothermale]UBM62444.1 undecaprenyl/decaprenyl-phosphate alpha-N-acetylglucosaminyl 1-phosphate transferase [Candidatus Sulfidibacterium hydrothermale]
MEILFANEHLIMWETLILSFMITYVSIPPLIEVAKAKNLYDVPNGRTSHEKITPTLGGIAIFSGFVIASMIFINIAKIPYIQYIIAGSLVIFFVGLKDDIIGLSPLKKFVGQIIAAAIIIDLGGVRLSSLHGFAGIGALNYVSSDFLSLFVIVAIINAFNLIDGIDGLSSGVGILASLAFGGWFLLIGKMQLALLAVALIGGLLAFFRFNFFSKRYKIFMGDIGSLLVGFILAIFAIKFNELNAAIAKGSSYFIKASPAVSIGILIIPIFDTVRVMVIRMAKGISPFKPDKRHIHHYLYELTGSHRKATSILLLVNLFFIGISFWLSSLRVLELTVILVLIATFLTSIPYYLLKKRRNKKRPVSSFIADAD